MSLLEPEIIRDVFEALDRQMGAHGGVPLSLKALLRDFSERYHLTRIHAIRLNLGNLIHINRMRRQLMNIKIALMLSM